MKSIPQAVLGRLRTLAFACVALPVTLAAQTPPVTEARLDTRRAQATRVELEASLLQIDSILGSPGYSSRIRDAKRREATLIRQLLTEGDLLVGDQVVITVINETTLSGTFQIGAGQVLSIPGLPEIPLRGVLRSEAEDHLRRELGKYVRDPAVRVQTNVRLAILGAVGKQGFYQVPADLLISDAIMAAGGPGSSTDPNRTEVKRAGTVILTQEQVQDALIRGTTLDQLNLRAGDELHVDAKQVQRRSTISILTVVGLLTTTIYMVTQIF